jgi:predicted dehydrogenase
VAINWGIIGPGGIATRFAEAMTMVDGGEIVAVASRSLDRAQAFGERFAVASSYDDVRALAADTRVDAVYVATPHSRHEADTLLAIAAGKHVLCEKPFAINANQARRMAEAARARGTFLMEAMWSRFLPAYRVLADVLSEGRIGDPLLAEADFGFRAPVRPQERHFDLSLGGGALLDLGIYPVQLCSLVFGAPDRVTGDGVIGTTGVDEHVVAVLRHPGDGLGVVKAAIRVPMSCRARISGSDGWIELPAFMHCPDHIVVGAGGRSDRIVGAFEGDGLRFEIAAMQSCIEQGRTECDLMPLDESVAMAGTLDRIRAQIGLVYPGEDP